jgi:hypothetical protein
VLASSWLCVAVQNCIGSQLSVVCLCVTSLLQLLTVSFYFDFILIMINVTGGSERLLVGDT